MKNVLKPLDFWVASRSRAYWDVLLFPLDCNFT
jgi:hypothetical protein